MKRIPISYLLSALIIAGCGSGNADDTSTQPGNVAVPQFPSFSGDSANVATKPAEAGSATVALNPAHGQPGHRCDIAVGAPLNSAPTIKVPTDSVKAPGNGLNPAHGQPGHRCEIAVGAPLDSKPTTPVTTTTTTSTSSSNDATNTNKAKPATAEATPVSSAFKPANGLNPKHGMPGHRCDLPEGAKLDGTPATPFAPQPKAITPFEVTPIAPANNKAGDTTKKQ